MPSWIYVEKELEWEMSSSEFHYQHSPVAGTAVGEYP